MSQNHEKMSTVELQIAERARKHKGEALHNLHHYIDEALSLRGHYNYYGVTFNGRSLNGFFMAVKYRLHKWLNRRGGKINVDKYTPLVKPFIKHSYVSLSRT